MTAQRTTRKRDWFNNQPGAWVMVMLPAVAGFIIGGPTLDALWLLAAWAACYCVQYSAARWFKSRFSSRYLPPMITYAAVLAVIGVPFLITHIGILRWAPLYIVLVALSMLSSWLRKERSLWGNAVSVIAASTMTTVVAQFGSNGITYQTYWATVLFTLTQYGSVLVVKTMIRERGKRSYVAASWIWHVMLVALTIVAGHNPFLMTMSVLLLARAIALPVAARYRTMKPVVTGITEAFASLIAFGCILAAVLM